MADTSFPKAALAPAGMMRAIAAKRYSLMGKLDTLEDVLLPKPTPGPRDLLVRIKASATNPVDFKILANFGAESKQGPAEPLIVGYDGAGIVEAIGDKVTMFKPGDEVYAFAPLNRQGTHAQYFVVDERYAGIKPKNLTYAQAAAIPLCFETAYEALFTSFQLTVPESIGKTILITAGAGGVGCHAIEIAKNVLHMKVITTASRKETVDFCKQKGADYVINHREPLVPQLKALGIESIDFAFECFRLDQQKMEFYAEVMSPFGKIASIQTAGIIDARLMFLKSLSLHSVFLGARGNLNHNVEYYHKMITDATKMFEAGLITPSVTKEFPFSVDGVKAALQLHVDDAGIGKFAIVHPE